MNTKLLFLPLALGLSMAPATAVFPQTLGIYPPLQRLQLADTPLETDTRFILSESGTDGQAGLSCRQRLRPSRS